MSAPGECFLRDTLMQPQWLCLESVSHSVRPLIPQLNKVSCSQDDERLAERWVSSQDERSGGGGELGTILGAMDIPNIKKRLKYALFIEAKGQSR